MVLQEKEYSYGPNILACRHNLYLRITWGGSHLVGENKSKFLYKKKKKKKKKKSLKDCGEMVK